MYICIYMYIQYEVMSNFQQKWKTKKRTASKGALRVVRYIYIYIYPKQGDAQMPTNRKRTASEGALRVWTYKYIR